MGNFLRTVAPDRDFRCGRVVGIRGESFTTEKGPRHGNLSVGARIRADGRVDPRGGRGIHAYWIRIREAK